jgi:hypothetical protein
MAVCPTKVINTGFIYCEGIKMAKIWWFQERAYLFYIQ